MRLVAMMTALSSLVLAPRASAACSLFYNPVFELSPDPSDTTPPSEVSVVASSLERLPDDSMCARDGLLSLRVTAHDDRGAVGYRVTVVTGTIEPAIDSQPMSPGLTGELVFYPATLAPPYELELRAVDGAGNLGPPTRVTFATVAGDAGDPGGCSTGGGARPWLGLLAPLGLVLGRRRR